MPELRRRASVSHIAPISRTSQDESRKPRRATISEQFNGIASAVARSASFQKHRRALAPLRKHGKTSFLRKAWSKARCSLLGLKPPQTDDDDQDLPAALQRGWDVARHVVHGTGQALQDSKRMVQRIRELAEAAHHQHLIQKRIMEDMQAAFAASLMVPSDGMEKAIGDIISELYSVKMLDLTEVAEHIGNVLLELESSREAVEKLRNLLLDHLQSFEDYTTDLGMSHAEVEALLERVLGQVASLREQVLAARSVSAGTQCAKPKPRIAHHSTMHLSSVEETARFGKKAQLAEHAPFDELQETQDMQEEVDTALQQRVAIKKIRHSGTYDFGSNSERRMMMRHSGTYDFGGNSERGMMMRHAQESDGGEEMSRHAQESDGGEEMSRHAQESDGGEEMSRHAEGDSVFGATNKSRWRKIQSTSRLLTRGKTRGRLETSETCEAQEDGDDDEDAASEDGIDSEDDASEESCSELINRLLECNSEEEDKEKTQEQREAERAADQEDEQVDLPIEKYSEQVSTPSLEIAYLPQLSQRPLSRLHVKGRGFQGMPSLTRIGSKVRRRASAGATPQQDEFRALTHSHLAAQFVLVNSVHVLRTLQ
eukprot:TRINITY_DN1273_c0_g1_i8.p1 TRINITY_DN1273_c0_g1~~TRINITY_DN1273_c0_g1_i8.p1  ORF type:complete len:598 (+),score=141.51 TRINITY_DN1273_c0_g1_i8:138-1931(+)